MEAVGKLFILIVVALLAVFVVLFSNKDFEQAFAEIEHSLSGLSAEVPNASHTKNQISEEVGSNTTANQDWFLGWLVDMGHDPGILDAALAESGSVEDFLLLIDTDYSHASNHGIAAYVTRFCLDNWGADQVWRNPLTNRKAEICLIDDIHVGVRITEVIDGKEQEITAYYNNRANALDQIVKGLVNRGYIK